VNKDQVKGALKVAEGKVQSKFGKLTGNTAQRVKGAVRQAEGKTLQVVGAVKETLQQANRKPGWGA